MSQSSANKTSSRNKSCPRIPVLRFRSSHSGPRIPVLAFRSSNSGPWIPVLEFWSSDSGPRIPFLGFRSLNSGPQDPVLKFRSSDSGSQIPVLGFRSYFHLVKDLYLLAFVGASSNIFCQFDLYLVKGASCCITESIRGCADTPSTTTPT
jgi:hypothetical protein